MKTYFLKEHKYKNDGIIQNNNNRATFTQVCVAQCFLSVQSNADILPIRGRWVGAGSGALVVPSSTSC